MNIKMNIKNENVKLITTPKLKLVLKHVQQICCLFVLVTDEAFVTLATNDSYALGALVLGNSLKLVGTTRSLAVMITDGVSENLK